MNGPDRLAPSLVIHGGAWDIPDDEWDDHRRGVAAALEVGWSVLARGESSVEAVVAAVTTLEDDPTFDAGRGSALNAQGEVEMDAALAVGEGCRVGAVAAVRTVQNPILAARAVLERTEHVLLVGPGADTFARLVGLPSVEGARLVVEREQRRWERICGRSGYSTRHPFEPGAMAQGEGPTVEATPAGVDPAGADPSGAAGSGDASSGTGARSGTPGGGPWGTVGAVAIDRWGRLAAATSTGGTPGKLPGRVGDSPVAGAGTAAEHGVGAVSCTGWGEAILRTSLAHRVLERLEAGLDPAEAARQALARLSALTGGRAGLICVDARGRVGLHHLTPRMAWACCAGGGPPLLVPR